MRPDPESCGEQYLPKHFWSQRSYFVPCGPDPGESVVGQKKSRANLSLGFIGLLGIIEIGGSARHPNQVVLIIIWVIGFINWTVACRRAVSFGRKIALCSVLTTGCKDTYVLAVTRISTFDTV
jgi:hypothetical protein